MQNKETYNVETVKKVAKALEYGGHNVEIIDGNMNVIESLQEFMPKVLEGEKMGMVFNMAYGIQGESRYTHIPSMLEMIGIPYVGSNPSGHALALDKVIAKIIMQKQNIPTPQFWVYSNHNEDMSDVEYPVIVKPKMEAVSFGLKVVYNEEDLRGAVQFIISEYQQQALVEQFIRGREFAIGVLGNGNSTEAFPILEIDLENDPDAIQSVTDKKEKPRRKICPAKLDVDLAAKMQEASINSFKALQLNDFARVDIRLDENNNFYILEINSMASLGSSGSFPFAAKAAGFSYNDLVNKMLDVAAIRYFGDEYLNEKMESDSNSLKPLQRVKSFVKNKQDVFVKDLEKIVNINSYVRNINGVNSIGSFFIKQLSLLGFSHQVLPQAEVGNMYYFSNSDSDKHDILLLGNIDSLTSINKHKYFRTNSQKLYGTGIWEHKGGLIVLLAALKALKSIKGLSKNRIAILLTSDSSLHNKISAPIIKEKAAKAKYIFGLNGAKIDGGLVSSRAGAAIYSASVNLINNSEPENITKVSSLFSKMTNAWVNLSDLEKGILVSPSNLELNSNFQRISCHGKINLSIRYRDIDDIKYLDEKISKSIPKRNKDLVDFYFNKDLRRPAMPKTDKIDQCWLNFKEMANKLDIRLREEHRWSSSDICYAEQDKFKIDGLGPIGSKNENMDEYILTYSLIERAALLALVIYNL
jgi:D-alanine-D-alanine ligase